MLVKCQVCGNKVERDIAFKRVVKGKNLYYHSEAEYFADKEKKRNAVEDKDRVYDLITKIFGYEIQNSALFKEWIAWNKLKNNEIIAKYLEDNETYLTRAITRSTSSEYARIRYFSAILKNDLADYKPKVEINPEPVSVNIDETYQTKYKPKVRVMSLEELEEEAYDE